jgi:hypothetical protein
MTHYQTRLEIDKMAAFIVRNVVVKDGILSLELHEPISPNASQKLMKDFRTTKLFSFELIIMSELGETVLSRDFHNIELLDINFEKFHAQQIEEPYISATFKI